MACMSMFCDFLCRVILVLAEYMLICRLIAC